LEQCRNAGCMRGGSRSAEERTEARHRRRDTVRSGNDRILPDGAAGRSKVCRRNRCAILLEEHASGTIGTEIFNASRWPARKCVRESKRYIHRCGRKSVSGGGMAASPTRGVVRELAEDAIQVHKPNIAGD